MVFNSLVFLLFLGAVLGGFYATPSWRVRKVFLLLASYVFYGAWKPAFTLLLLLSTVIDWVVARRIEGSEKTSARRAWLILSLATNLGILAPPLPVIADCVYSDFNAPHLINYSLDSFPVPQCKG